MANKPRLASALDLAEEIRRWVTAPWLPTLVPVHYLNYHLHGGKKAVEELKQRLAAIPANAVEIIAEKDARIAEYRKALEEVADYVDHYLPECLVAYNEEAEDGRVSRIVQDALAANPAGGKMLEALSALEVWVAVRRGPLTGEEYARAESSAFLAAEVKVHDLRGE